MNIIEFFRRYEKGTIVAPEILHKMSQGGRLVLTTFSCLSGEPNQFPENLGKFFESGKHKPMLRMLRELKEITTVTFRVIIDDTDPIRIWGSTLPQTEITDWLKLLIEDAQQKEELQPFELKLWSEMEKESGDSFELALQEIQTPCHALLVYHRLEHMRKRPPRRLAGNLKQASELRVAQFALQGKVFEVLEPRTILVQTDTPWKVKDPPYQALRRIPLPIIHPFEEIK